jgi:uncharacterized membrane protein
MSLEESKREGQESREIPTTEPAGAQKERALIVENVALPADSTPVERAAGIAKEQASEAAQAWRRGEFMQDAAVDPDANSDDRLIALLSYITQIVMPVILPIIVLLSESSKNRPFQRYHAVQSLALVLTLIGVSLGVIIGAAILQIIPVIGWLVGFLVLCLSPIAYLMGVIALLYYGYQAYQGKRFAIPGLTSFLHDQGWLG